MKFFKPEDFENIFTISEQALQYVVDLANSKLERETIKLKQENAGIYNPETHQGFLIVVPKPSSFEEVKFFKPEDFTGCLIGSAQEVASYANAKLEREGKVVYGYTSPSYTWDEVKPDKTNTKKALLINIESIEQCKHEANKVIFYRKIINSYTNTIEEYFKCECGATVKPGSFVKVE